MKKYIQTLLLLFLLCSVKDIFASPAKQVNSWNNLSSSSTTGIFQNGTQTLTDLNQALYINISSSNYTPKAAYSFFHNKKLYHDSSPMVSDNGSIHYLYVIRIKCYHWNTSLCQAKIRTENVYWQTIRYALSTTTSCHYLTATNHYRKTVCLFGEGFRPYA